MLYSGKNLKEIVFPLGGIGTGSVGLAGNGRLCDFEIFNRPSKGSLMGFTHLAVSAEWAGKRDVRVLNGDCQKDLMGQYRKSTFRGYGFGPDSETMAGFPHFSEVVFDGRFPVASLTFRDSSFPAAVGLTAFNPMIPHDAENSCIPAAFFAVRLENPTAEPIHYTVCFTVCNPNRNSRNRAARETGRVSVTMSGDGIPQEDPACGDLTCGVLGEDLGVQEYGYRGDWQDRPATYWRELSVLGALRERSYDTPCEKGGDSCTVYARVTLLSGETREVPFVLAWSYPNRINDWKPWQDAAGKDIPWRNHYATRFRDSAETFRYAAEHFDTLRKRTERFRDILFSSTVDPAVLDAVSANLAVLKSPTVLRTENGRLWGWEGVHEQAGSCEGSCQHVWSYAYALCFLFPELERGMRENELEYGYDPKTGKTEFRLGLPLGRADYRPGVGERRACLDGQMGTVMRMWREWKLSGDTAWLEKHWEKVKGMLAYAWSEQNPDAWDRDRDGVLEGRQHHTLDMELFGPSAWLEGMYLGALEAGAEMADAMWDDVAELYRSLLANGKRYLREKLFCGTHFVQRIDLNDPAVPARFGAAETYWNAEAGEIKYQIGAGCEIDQMLGQWHTDILGLDKLFDEAQVATALDTLWRNNHKRSLRDFANPWRVFALNDEAATVICTYPEGTSKPAIPIPYCEESMNGFEYALGGLMLAEGKTAEGLEIVRAVRARYNGENRNPWGEMECGSNYARSMASFALLPILSGFLFDLPAARIGFSPRTEGAFRCLFSVGTCYGSYARAEDGATELALEEGTLTLGALTLPYLTAPQSLHIDGEAAPFTFDGKTLTFPKRSIRKTLKVR
ncbi:MAG TPA: hypothetical protein DDW30_08765 [Clostridiales bacterium]|nr:hypothetical protein [Clostridiales bacterium]